MGRQRLGKGLRALIPVTPEDEDVAGRGDVVRVMVDEIEPSPFQPRRDFDEEKIDELAQSIRQHGIVQPLVLRKREEGYELVVGQRRWMAAQRLGMKDVPALIEDLDDRQVMEIALIENLQREDLDPIEEADAYRRLIDEFGLTQEELASAVGRSRSSITNSVRLLNLPEDIQESVSRGTISMGHARALLGLEDEAAQREVWEVVVEGALSVRECEDLVRRRRSGEQEAQRETEEERPDPAVTEAESVLRERLGTQVRIRTGKRKGRIEIEFYTSDDLERILALLGSTPFR